MIGTDVRNDIRQGARWGTLLAALGMAALASLAPSRITAQVATAQTAVARPQPRFTRIFGSDSMEIVAPALSPDGRWIAFNTSTLWVVPASGGAPIQLTSGLHSDWAPKWFPPGDRIAFVSRRPSPPDEVQAYVMTIPFDAQTGRTAGPAQQVSLEPAFDAAVSPDGRWIVFETMEVPGSRRLMVVPSTGGTARMVTRTEGLLNRPQWSPDGREIYFVDRAPGATERTLKRVSAEGGRPQRLLATSQRIWLLSTATRQLLTWTGPSPSGSQVAQVLTFEGRPVVNVPLHRNMLPFSFTGDGQSVLAVVSDVVAPIHMVPVAGGPLRSLTEAREYDELDSWSTDATRISIVTRTNGHSTLLDFSVDGGVGVEVATPPEA
ncbi:MAG: hypothetical protein Q8N53_11175, partial [Longimicrobiales bacterium]|nr:hypothetical protein [Longimicrobiales bacterium]